MCGGAARPNIVTAWRIQVAADVSVSDRSLQRPRQSSDGVIGL